MRSGTSFFNWTVFKKTFLRFWPVWTAYTAIWFIALPLNALMMLQMEARAYPGVTGGYLESFARNTVPGMTALSLFMAVAFGLLAAMAVCSHLYNPRAANLFGALPVRREGLFLTHYLAGLAFLLLPNAAIFLLTLAIEGVGGAVSLPGLLFWLGVACGECLFFYSMAVFCAMFTGHILALPAFYGIFNALAVVLYYLLEWVFHSFYYGFHIFESGLAGLVQWLTPVWKLAQGIGSYSTSGLDAVMAEQFQGWGILAVYAVVAVVLTAGSFFLYRFRRLESAGDVVSVKCMRPVFKYSVAACSGLCFGMLTAQVVYMHEPGLMASMVVWAVAGYFVAQMLLDKTFRVFRKWKGAVAVAAAFAAVFLVVGFDLTGFETRVPAADQVASVRLSGLSVSYMGDDGDYLGETEGDPALIDLAILLHREAVAQRDVPRPSGAPSCSLGVSYQLKNGATLTRRYTIWVDTTQVDQEGTAAWAIQQIYNDRELYWRAYGFEEAERRMAGEGYRLDEVSFEDENRASGADYSRYYYGADAQELYRAVKEDFQAGRIGVRTLAGDVSWDGTWRCLQFRFTSAGGSSFHISIQVQEASSSTLAVLGRLAGAAAAQPQDAP